jgi:hypothetical protein
LGCTAGDAKVLASDIARLEATNLYVAESFPQIDGLWWEEWEGGYTAPRGVILPSRLDAWRVTKGAPLNKWEPDDPEEC